MLGIPVEIWLAAGLALFDTQIRQFVEPQNNPAHLENIIQVLESGCGGKEQKTTLLPVLSELAERVSRRSLVVVISDFFGPLADTMKGLQIGHRNQQYKQMHMHKSTTKADAAVRRTTGSSSPVRTARSGSVAGSSPGMERAAAIAKVPAATRLVSASGRSRASSHIGRSVLENLGR